MLRIVKLFAVVDFRQTRRPRSYLPRREQWHLLMLVILLGLVVILMGTARDPENWAWLFASGDDQGGSAADNALADNPATPEPEVAQQSGLAESTGPSADDQPAPSGDEPPTTSGPREALRMHGVDDSCFQHLIDGQPLADSETDTLLRVMFWIRDFSMLEMEQWAGDPLDLIPLVEDPQAARGRLFRLSGRVVRVEPLRPSPEEAELFELGQYYRCEILLGERRQPAVVFAAGVPKQWPQGAAIDQRSGAFGLLLKFAGSDPDRPLPVFVTRHMAWYPPTLLGDLGMDTGLLDDVVDGTGLGRARGPDAEEVERAAREREAFYALLDAVGRSEPGQLLGEADRLLAHADQELKWTDRQGNLQSTVEPLFFEPRQQRGRLVVLSGRARRVVRIQVEDADVLARFGIDHYYEVSLFTADSGENPVVFCVRELPPGMPTGDGPDYREQLRVAGFSLKLWSYPISSSGRASQAGQAAQRQPAPLLIGRRPIWYQHAPSATSPIAGAIVGGLFVLALLGTWLVLWRTARRDRQFHDRTVARSRAAGSPVSFPISPADTIQEDD